MLRHCDGALIIGDNALKISPDEYEVLDLARAWIDWQGLPFVFALWACPADSGMRGDLVSLIGEAKAWGLGRRDEIARIYARRLGLAREFLAGYLAHNINYEFGPRHIEGLSRYYELSANSRKGESQPPSASSSPDFAPCDSNRRSPAVGRISWRDADLRGSGRPGS